MATCLAYQLKRHRPKVALAHALETTSFAASRCVCPNESRLGSSERFAESSAMDDQVEFEEQDMVRSPGTQRE